MPNLIYSTGFDLDPKSLADAHLQSNPEIYILNITITKLCA